MRTVAILFLSLLLSSVSFAEEISQELDAKGLKTLVVQNRSGDLKVGVSPDGKAHIKGKKIEFSEACEFSVKREASELLVKVDGDNSAFGNDCRVELEIFVPKDIALNIINGTGDVEVNETKGPIELRIGTGDVKLNAIIEQLKAITGTGQLDVSGLAGDAEIKAGTGDVSVAYPSLPEKGQLSIKVGTGHATVFLPESSQILSDATSGLGSIYNEIGDSEQARFKVTLKAGLGDLKIKKAAPPVSIE